MNKKLASAVLAVLGLLIFMTGANAQCVQCSTQGRKFICAPSSTDGRGCVTNEAGTSCAVSQPCAASPTQASWEGLVLEERLVAEVGRTEPHFAEALSFLRKHTELLVDGYAKLYLLPKEAGKSARPAASKEDELFSTLKRFEEREQNASPVEPAVYEVTLDRAEGAATGILKISLLSSKPNGVSSILVINLMKADKDRWIASGWETSPTN